MQHTVPTVAGSETVTKSIVKWWLAGAAGLIFAMVVVGGVTRLTESGLSMVTWEPIKGARPPLNEEDWEHLFEQYKQYPEYSRLNPNMSLSEFKNIFWMEWSHRALGRFLGVYFALPLAYFWKRNYLGTSLLKAQMTAVLAGIGFEGFLGWYMVKSGLEDEHNARVSPYRLAAHLGSAFVLYSGILWVALEMFLKKPVEASAALLPKKFARLSNLTKLTALLVFTTALSGAFVAGLDAGLVYNTFPLMGEGLVPPEYHWRKPIKEKLFEIDATVQFNHRWLAMGTYGFVTAAWLWARRMPLPKRTRLAFNTMFAVATGQVLLGITTLLTLVPIPLAACHQAGSLTLLSVALWTLGELKRVKRA